MNRRTFCRNSLQLGALSMMGFPQISLAQSTQDLPGFLVIMKIPGGWDTSLSLDPWTQKTRLAESECFIEYREDELLPFGNTFVGPAMAPLKKYFDRAAIVRGLYISNSEVAHDVARDYQASGSGDASLGSLNVELEGQISDSLFGVMANLAFPVGHRNATVWDINDLRDSKKMQSAATLMSFKEKSSELGRARQALLQGTEQIESFNRELSKFGDIIRDEHIIAAAFLARTSSSAVLTLTGGNLDTHSDHPVNHLRDLTAYFEQVKSMLDALAASKGVNALGQQSDQRTLLDQTTVLVVSDFTRTPSLVSGKGKNHNPQMNANLLFGPGIKAGVIGGSNVISSARSATGNSYYAAAPTDVETFMPVNRRENAFLIRPENIIATVTRSMGFDPGKIAPSLGNARVLKALLK